MQSTLSHIFLIGLLSTVTIIQGKPMYLTGSNTKADSIKHLLKISGAVNEYNRFLSYLKIDPPEGNSRLKDIYRDLFSEESYAEDIAQVYDKYYTTNEIIKLTKFYASPLGQKFVRVNNNINEQMENIMLDKVTDYVFTAQEDGIHVPLGPMK